MPIKNNFKRFLNDFKKLKSKIPVIVGGIAVGFAKDNFIKQGFDNGSVAPWQKRKELPENKRFAREEEKRQQERVRSGKRRTRGRNPRKTKGRSILVGTGELKKSIRILRRGNNSVTVGSSLPYAGIHNEGGNIIQTPTEKQKAFFFAKYKETENEIYLQMATAKQLKIRIPKRKFLGRSKTLNQKIQAEVKLQISKLFNF